MTLLSQSLAINYADITVIALLAIGLLAGGLRGFAKTIAGGAGSLAAIVLAVVAAVFLKQYLQADSSYLELKSKIVSGIAGWNSVFNMQARYVDGSLQLLSEDNWLPIGEILSGFLAVAAKPLSSLLNILAPPETFVAVDGVYPTIAEAVAPKISEIVLMVIIFVVSAIVVKLLLNVLAKGVYKLSKENKGVKTTDKLIGLIFSAVLMSGIVLVALYLVRDNADKESIKVVVNEIEKSQIAKWLYENNPLIAVLAKQ